MDFETEKMQELKACETPGIFQVDAGNYIVHRKPEELIGRRMRATYVNPVIPGQIYSVEGNIIEQISDGPVMLNHCKVWYFYGAAAVPKNLTKEQRDEAKKVSLKVSFEREDASEGYVVPYEFERYKWPLPKMGMDDWKFYLEAI